ncbi:uncharacterized protein LOC123686591 isoform X2 [Harmonia axyridis]|uniref:uncharacterized protein LOC123686591 isoform X2 n=1 Tax=Harmonia axyridis TaxID=115357 RepID=UPI001E275C1D|nr:uncharacterized protein LOC123686591 isoform X2 [Harmonia axyridis]
MDIDALIAEVYKRSAIWNKNHKLHSNRNIVDKCWREISLEMNEDGNKLRKKWKYLRDQFSVELGKCPILRSGDAPEDELSSKWTYFTQLLFLKDVVKPRASSGNLSAALQLHQREYGDDASQSFTRCDVSNENEYFDEIPQGSDRNEIGSTFSFKNNKEQDTENIRADCDNENASTLSPASTGTEKPVAKRRRTLMNDEFNTSLLDIEKRKLEYLEAKSRRQSYEEDEHLLFFKSLLPYVRKIPESRILAFRCRVQELVDDSIYYGPEANSFPNISKCSNSPS